MHIGGNTEELIRQLPNMRIKTFTHDYYMLELPASLDAQFYK